MRGIGFSYSSVAVAIYSLVLFINAVDAVTPFDTRPHSFILRPQLLDFIPQPVTLNLRQD